jgi:hypothetical protein
MSKLAWDLAQQKTLKNVGQISHARGSPENWTHHSQSRAREKHSLPVSHRSPILEDIGKHVKRCSWGVFGHHEQHSFIIESVQVRNHIFDTIGRDTET